MGYPSLRRPGEFLLFLQLRPHGSSNAERMTQSYFLKMTRHTWVSEVFISLRRRGIAFLISAAVVSRTGKVPALSGGRRCGTRASEHNPNRRERTAATWPSLYTELPFTGKLAC